MAQDISKDKVWKVGTLTYTKIGLFILFFWLLWGDFAWSIRDRTVAPVLQILLKKFGSSDSLVGFLTVSLPAAVSMILGPIISYRSDRHRGSWGRRIPFLIFPTPVSALCMFGLAVSPFLGKALSQSLGAEVLSENTAVLSLLGLFFTLFLVAAIIANSVFYALINDVVPSAVLGRFFGAFRAISLIAGMIFNYWLMGKADSHYAWIFMGTGAIYGLGFSFMCLKVKEGDYPPPPPPSTTTGIKGAALTTIGYFKECFGKPYYLLVFIAITCVSLLFLPVNTYCLFYAKSLNISMATFGMCIFWTYLISLILAYPLGVLADRFHPIQLGLACILAFALLTLWGSFFIHDTITYCIGLVGHGVISGSFMSSTASLSQKLLPRSKYAEYLSAAFVFVGFLSIGFATALGYLLDNVFKHEYHYTYVLAFALSIIYLLVFIALYFKFQALGGKKNYIAPE